MSKNTLESLSSELRQKQQELATIQGNLPNQQNQYQLAERQLSQALTQQATLNDQLQKLTNNFQALRHLCGLYREEKGIALNPDIIMTKIISAKDLAHTDVLKEACKSHYQEGFDLGLAKITDLDFQDIDGKTILMHAIINGFYYGVGKLLERGADVNLIDNQGANALIYCADIPHIKYLKQIAEKTTDINYKSKLFADKMVIHVVIVGINKTIFTSELNNELQDLDQAHIIASQLIVDENFTITRLDGARASDGYTVNQEKALRIIKFLTAKGADINSQNEQGLTPFFYACICKLRYLASKLIDQYKLDFALSDANGHNAIDYALHLGDTSVVQLMLDKGIDINGRNNTGATPLYAAVYTNDKVMTKFLLSKGANANIPAKDGSYPLHMAVQKDLLDIMDLLIKHCDINSRAANAHQITALWLAAQDGKLDIIKFLIKHGADLNIVREDTAMPPLYVAMQKKQILAAEELLARGADVNMIDANGFIALHWGVNLEDINIVKNILTKGTNINAKSTTEATPLFCAVSNGNKLITELLISKQADTNIPSNEGASPWHIASFKGFIEIMKILAPTILDIDYKATNAEQYTALWLASQQGHSNIVKWLAEHGADVNIARQTNGTTALQIAIVNNHLPVVKVLVEECKADINKANLDGASPLYYSLGYWHQDYKLEITKFLIEHGASIDKKTAAGDQPIHRASNLADVKAMKLLLDHGVSINEVNNDGYTPLHFLVGAENTIEADKKLTAIKYLLERSASSAVKNKEGKSAIDLAKDNFPEALPWLEHPENLPPLSEFEASLVGINDFAI